MADEGRRWQIGDAVLVDFDGARIPGVIEDDQDGKVLVRLADPWIDETGQKNDTQWVTIDRLEAYLSDASGGEQALPG